MRISEIVKMLEEIKQEHGDLQVFDDDAYNIDMVNIMDNPEDFPSSYKMPEAWVEITSSDK